METDNKARILRILCTDLSHSHTITSLSLDLGLSRAGIWKIIKKLHADNLVKISKIGDGKTNLLTIWLNWQNPLTEKSLALILSQEAAKYQRWISCFSELQKKSSFVVIYGSILSNSKNANDIDLLCIVSNKKQFVEVEKTVLRIQKTQFKKIHSLSFTSDEFAKEIRNKNPVFINALKYGFVLFGQENFIKFYRNIGEK